MPNIRVTNVELLKQILDDGEPKDFHIALSGGRSSKVIDYSKSEDTFFVTHLIDDTEEELTEEQLLSETNIGIAIKEGTFFYEKDEDDETQFEFSFTISGRGATPEEAFDNACEGFEYSCKQGFYDGNYGESIRIAEVENKGVI